MFMEDAPFSYTGGWSGVEPACTAKGQCGFLPAQSKVDQHRSDQSRKEQDLCVFFHFGMDNELCFVCVRYLFHGASVAIKGFVENKWPLKKLRSTNSVC